MSRNRRERRKLAKLSTNPNFIKPYNHQVRLHNQKVVEVRKKDRKVEYYTFFVLLGIVFSVLCYKIWLKE